MAKKKKSPHHAVGLNSLVDEKIAAVLAVAGIKQVFHVRKMTDKELKAVKGIGPKAAAEIRAATT